jgi:putative transposase
MLLLSEQHCSMRERDDGDQLQRGPFPPEVMLMGVRWSLAYPLSTRHVEALRLARGVHVDHSRPVHATHRWS